MLRRQRAILKLLSTAGGSLSATQVQKLLFLLRQETFLRSDSAFYDFLPYKYGPYSFAANREIEALVAYVVSCGGGALRIGTESPFCFVMRFADSGALASSHRPFGERLEGSG